MESAMDMSVLLRFLLRTLGVFALIFILALLTPKIAAIVDKWIKRYRDHHDPKQDETYGIRSIYELPPKDEPAAEESLPDEEALLPDEPETVPEETVPAEEIPLTEEETSPSGDMDETDAPETAPESAEAIVPWFMR